MKVRIILHRINLSLPLWLVLVFLGFGTTVYTFLITLPETPEIFLLLFSSGSTDVVSRIMLSFFTLFVLFSIHLEHGSEPDLVEQFLLKNLPAILWGFGLACFFLYEFNNLGHVIFS